MNEISLTLKGYCIETAARFKLDCLIREAIEVGENIELLEKIDLLREFIMSTDFRQLRSNRPELDGRLRCDVIIRKETGSTFYIQIFNCQSDLI